MDLVKPVELSKFWDFVNAVLGEGVGVEIAAEKFNFALSVEAYTVNGDPGGFTVHSDLDSFMASMLKVMCATGNNYRVVMSDDEGDSLTIDAQLFIDGGGVIVFLLTNENKVA